MNMQGTILGFWLNIYQTKKVQKELLRKTNWLNGFY